MEFAAFLCLLLLGGVPALEGRKERFSNSWAVEVRGGAERAEEVARKHGFVNLGQVGNLGDVYHFVLEYSAQHDNTGRAIYSLRVVDSKPEMTVALQTEEHVGYVKQQELFSHVKKGYEPPRNTTDPTWNEQWALVNLGQTCGPSGVDMNVEPAWMQGITGKGVVVAFVDDGMEHTHPDLTGNYDPSASWDFADNDDDPTPTYNPEEPNRHGTSCAGEVGMAKDNGVCGVGVAYESNIGGIKVDNADSSDLIESNALSYRGDYVQVYSNSWGPSDFGFVVNGPKYLVQWTFENAVKTGRGGKGSIYVWAAGNGGDYYDSCAADGYSSSIYTIAIGSADQNAGQADYDEQCSAKMAVTISYNSDTFPTANDSWSAYNQISTTTLNGQCADDFTGTSASAPLASGAIALALQANPDLTWRDVQYLIAYTSNSDILRDGEWATNGAGLNVNHKFGFGAIDAEAMVTRARRWTSVPEQHMAEFHDHSLLGVARKSSPMTYSYPIQQSGFASDNQISYLEHVVVTLTLDIGGYSKGYDYYDLYYYIYEHYDYRNDKDVENGETFDFDFDDFDMKAERDLYDWLGSSHTKRGDIMVELTSPHGTKSTLLPYRKYDFVNEEGYTNWPFMSVHHWGEDPTGTWTLKVTFNSNSGYVEVKNMTLSLYGTATTPSSVSSIPSSCDSACAGKCSGPGQENCDACKNFRIGETLECVGRCPNNTCQYKKYCLGGQQNYTSNCPKQPPPSPSPQSCPKPTPSPSEFPSSSPSPSPQSYPKPTPSPSESPSSSPSPPPPKSQSNILHIIIGVTVPAGIILLIVMVVTAVGFCYCCHRRKSHESSFQLVPLDDPVQV